MSLGNRFIRNPFLQYTGLFVLLIVVYLLFAVISCCLPDKTIKRHVKMASVSLSKYGNYPRSIIDVEGCQQDCFTEALVLNQIYCIDRHKPLKSAMAGERISISWVLPEDLWLLTHDQLDAPRIKYARYWHGSTFLFRYLLTFLSYAQIQWLLFAISCVLLLIFGAAYLPRVGIWKTAAMMMSWILVYGFMMFFSLQFTPVFLISLLASLFVVRLDGDNRKLSLLFFIAGSLTCYFDLLSTPMLSFGWPLLVWLSLRDDRPLTIMDVKQIVKWGFLWLIAMALTWLTKWVIGTIVLDYNVFKEGMDMVHYRTSMEQGASHWGAISKNLAMVPWMMVCLTLIVFVVCAAIRFKKPSWSNILMYLLVALAPYLWYLALTNHSFVHFWFTYRLQFITFCALLLAICSCRRQTKFR